jgi:hypothetical protein
LTSPELKDKFTFDACKSRQIYFLDLKNNTCWNPPSTGWVKVNFDAAVKESHVVLAAVCRKEDDSDSHAWT